MQISLALGDQIVRTQPFLRWAGGKSWLVKSFENYWPVRFNNYHEPFLGGGSVFFDLPNNKKSHLSDLNIQLVDTYTQVKDNVEDVIAHMRKFKNTPNDYYEIRKKRCRADISKAAQFIYLNKTSFNGIYRVNRQGVYNVPYGYRSKGNFLQEETLRLASLKLQSATLYKQDFEVSLKKVRPGDFVFIDPPYTVAHENNGFIAYNQKLFSLNDQHRLAESLITLNKIGVYFLLTNAHHTAIKEIYKNVGNFSTLHRNSLVGGKLSLRASIKEYIVKNY